MVWASYRGEKKVSIGPERVRWLERREDPSWPWRYTLGRPNRPYIDIGLDHARSAKFCLVVFAVKWTRKDFVTSQYLCYCIFALWVFCAPPAELMTVSKLDSLAQFIQAAPQMQCMHWSNINRKYCNFCNLAEEPNISQYIQFVSFQARKTLLLLLPLKRCLYIQLGRQRCLNCCRSSKNWANNLRPHCKGQWLCQSAWSTSQRGGSWDWGVHPGVPWWSAQDFSDNSSGSCHCNGGRGRLLC